MASAKDGYPKCSAVRARVVELDDAAQPARERAWRALIARLDDELLRAVEDVVRLTPTIVEVIVKAPPAAPPLSSRAVLPAAELRVGHRASRSAAEIPLLMEGIALTGAWVDKRTRPARR
jgi:hypothetical protein